MLKNKPNKEDKNKNRTRICCHSSTAHLSRVVPRLSHITPHHYPGHLLEGQQMGEAYLVQPQLTARVMQADVCQWQPKQTLHDICLLKPFPYVALKCEKPHGTVLVQSQCDRRYIEKWMKRRGGSRQIVDVCIVLPSALIITLFHWLNRACHVCGCCSAFSTSLINKSGTIMFVLKIISSWMSHDIHHMMCVTRLDYTCADKAIWLVLSTKTSVLGLGTK